MDLEEVATVVPGEAMTAAVPADARAVEKAAPEGLGAMVGLLVGRVGRMGTVAGLATVAAGLVKGAMAVLKAAILVVVAAAVGVVVA